MKEFQRVRSWTRSEHQKEQEGNLWRQTKHMIYQTPENESTDKKNVSMESSVEGYATETKMFTTLEKIPHAVQATKP